MDGEVVLLIVSAAFFLALFVIPTVAVSRKDKEDRTAGEAVWLLFSFAAVFFVALACLPQDLQHTAWGSAVYVLFRSVRRS